MYVEPVIQNVGVPDIERIIGPTATGITGIAASSSSHWKPTSKGVANSSVPNSPLKPAVKLRTRRISCRLKFVIFRNLYMHHRAT